LKSLKYKICLKKHTDQLSNVHVPSIVPVELNSRLNQNARILSTWFGKIGNKYKSTKYCTIAEEFLNGIQEVSIVSNYYSESIFQSI